MQMRKEKYLQMDSLMQRQKHLVTVMQRQKHLERLMQMATVSLKRSPMDWYSQTHLRLVRVKLKEIEMNSLKRLVIVKHLHWHLGFVMLKVTEMQNYLRLDFEKLTLMQKGSRMQTAIAMHLLMRKGKLKHWRMHLVKGMHSEIDLQMQKHLDSDLPMRLQKGFAKRLDSDLPTHLQTDWCLLKQTHLATVTLKVTEMRLLTPMGWYSQTHLHLGFGMHLVT